MVRQMTHCRVPIGREEQSISTIDIPFCWLFFVRYANVVVVRMLNWKSASLKYEIWEHILEWYAIVIVWFGKRTPIHAFFIAFWYFDPGKAHKHTHRQTKGQTLTIDQLKWEWLRMKQLLLLLVSIGVFFLDDGYYTPRTDKITDTTNEWNEMWKTRKSGPQQ